MVRHALIPCFISIAMIAGAAPPVFQTVGEAGSLSDRVVVIEGEYVDFTVGAVDPDGDPLVWTIEDLPSWLSLDSATGRVTGRAPTWVDDWQQRNQQIGAFDLTVSVSDGEWTSRKVVTLEILDDSWSTMSIAQLIAARPVTDPAPLHSPVELSDVEETTFTSEFGNGARLHKICCAFTSQVPAMEGAGEDWVSTTNCAYLPADGPAVQNAGAVVEGCYSQDFGERELAERVAAELKIPVLIIDRGWEQSYPSQIMGSYNQSASAQGRPELIWYNFSTYHFLRAADALATVISQYTNWPVDFDTFRVGFTGHSKFGRTSFLTAGADPGHVAGILCSGNVDLDGNSERLLGRLQGADAFGPEAYDGYLGVMMRSFLTNRLSQAQADPETVVIPVLGTDDAKGMNDDYGPKYLMTANVPHITLPNRLASIPNAPHTTQTPIHATVWKMLLAHIFLGRPLISIQSVTHRQTAQGIEVTAVLGAETTIRAVTVWASNQNDMDMSHWDGFSSYPAEVKTGATYTVTIPADSKTLFVEVLDTADGVDGLVSSPPEPVDGDYPLLGIPPDEVKNFSTRIGSGGLALSWRNPASTDLAGVLIIASDHEVPEDPLGGRVVFDGLAESALDPTPARFYAAFTYDSGGHYSLPVAAASSPRTPSGPVPRAFPGG